VSNSGVKVTACYSAQAILVLLFALSAFIAASPTRARASTQGHLDVFGYFEPQLAVESLDGEVAQLASNKLRLDIEATPTDRVTFGGNLNFMTYHGRTTYRLADYIPRDAAAEAPPGALDAYVVEFSDGYVLDNAFVKVAFSTLDVTVGKQQISPGTGYAWNPTDMYNTKDVLDPTYENPGHNVVAADVPLGARGALSVLYEPAEELRRSGTFARLKLPAGHFDVSAAVGERFVTHTDFLIYSEVLERRRMVGGDLSGQLLGAGLWGEFAYNEMEVSADYFEGLLGLDYTFENGLYVLGEFYTNGRGRCGSDDYDLNDWLRFLTAETRTVTRNQCYAYVNYPATDLVSIGGSVISSLSDGSLALVPELNYNIDTNLDLTLFGDFYLGEEGTAFSSELGQSCLLRIRYYF
jgi:hypothetical protein